MGNLGNKRRVKGYTVILRISVNDIFITFSVVMLKYLSVVFCSSVAILHYLCNRQIVSNDWYPSDVVQRARVDEFLAWQNSYGLRPNAMNTFIAQVYIMLSLTCLRLCFR